MPDYRPGNWPILAIGALVALNAVLVVALFAVAVPAADPPRASASVTIEPFAS